MISCAAFSAVILRITRITIFVVTSKHTLATDDMISFFTLMACVGRVAKVALFVIAFMHAPAVH